MTTYLCAKCQHVMQARHTDHSYVLVEPCSECEAAHTEEVRSLTIEVEDAEGRRRNHLHNLRIKVENTLALIEEFENE